MRNITVSNLVGVCKKGLVWLSSKGNCFWGVLAPGAGHNTPIIPSMDEEMLLAPCSGEVKGFELDMRGWTGCGIPNIAELSLARGLVNAAGLSGMVGAGDWIITPASLPPPGLVSRIRALAGGST